MTEYLTWDGKILIGDYDISNKDITAKVVYNIGLVPGKNKARYFIKSKDGFLYNPNLTRHMRNNRVKWKWREVNLQTLSSYVSFIQTKNPAHYNQAERTKGEK